MGRFLLVAPDIIKTGGMDRCNYALASYLAHRGDDLDLVACRVEDDLRACPNVTYHRAARPLNAYLLGVPFVHRLGRRQAREISRQGGRVIVNGGCCDWGDVNWVHHINVIDKPPAIRNPIWDLKNRIAYNVFKEEERRIIPKARTIITTCERTRNDILHHFDVRPEVVHPVYLGIDPALFHPSDAAERATTRDRVGWSHDRPMLLFIGALGNRRKGFDILYDAWKALCAEPSWDADLSVIGRGTELPLWQARAVEDGLEKRAHFLGFRPDMADLLRAADAHVLPSRYEGYSMVTQEALCCGLPAFITEVAGIADRYPDELKNLLLIPDPEDVTDLVARLRRWRETKDACRAAVEPFSVRLREHTWDRMSEQIVGLIENDGPPA